MVLRLLKLFVPLTIFRSINGNLALIPRFEISKSAIIIGSGKSQINSNVKNSIFHNIPIYKVDYQPGNNIISRLSVEEYPSDLLNVARDKLGVNDKNQLHSIKFLGKLLGTNNAENTIKYLRTLTSNDQGISVIKSYLEPSGNKENKSESVNSNTNIKIRNKDNTYNKFLTNRNLITNSKITNELRARITDFMKQYNLWLDANTTTRPSVNNRLLASPMHVKPNNQKRLPQTPAEQSLPYHYPIPLRPLFLTNTSFLEEKQAKQADLNQSLQRQITPPLNTSKSTPILSSAHLPPHVGKIAQLANISPEVMDHILRQKPKLANLMKRLNRLPLVHQHSRTIEPQLFIAVKKALVQDETLENFMKTSKTLE